MAADAADQDILDAELVDDDAVDWSGTALLPASTRSHHPRYLVDRHTVLAPGELPPTAEDQPRYTEADFRISATPPSAAPAPAPTTPASTAPPRSAGSSSGAPPKAASPGPAPTPPTSSTPPT